MPTASPDLSSAAAPRRRVSTPAIYADLQRRLMTAAFAPGERLRPKDLQGEYGCSANTVRDILLRLSKVGLVEFELQRGFRVLATSTERRRDITRFRILLEQEGAAMSVAAADVGWEADLAAAHHRLSHIERRIVRTGDVQGHMCLWSDAEREFHETLIAACGSEILRATYADIYARFRQQMVGLERDFGANYFEAIIREHQRILDAALARDAPACRAAIHDHLKRNL